VKPSLQPRRSLNLSTRKLPLRLLRPGLNRVLRGAELWKFLIMKISTSIYGVTPKCGYRGQARQWLPSWPGPVVNGWNRVVSWVVGCVHRKVG
jgi:hypothetical protein